MLNDINVKNSRDSLRCKYHLKQVAKTGAKKVATNENCILRKMVLKFQNPSFNISCKTAFWNKQDWLNKELKKTACLGGQPAFIIPNQLNNYVVPLS